MTSGGLGDWCLEGGGTDVWMAGGLMSRWLGD